MQYSQELHRYQETRHRESLTRADKQAKKEFWHGFAWAAAMHWCAIIVTLLTLAPAIKDTIEYAGQVSAIQMAVNDLPMMVKK